MAWVAIVLMSASPRVAASGSDVAHPAMRGAGLASAAAAPTPTPTPEAEPIVADEAPLDRFVATLDTAGLDGEPQLRTMLRTAEADLARAGAPREDCAASLGAERFAGLHASLARARQSLGDRSGARVAWQAAIACAPRRARFRIGLATVLLSLGRFAEADATVARARHVSPDAPGLDEVQARLDHAAGRWAEAASAAAAIAARLQQARETAAATAAAARPPRVVPRDDDAPDAGGETRAFWLILERLARRRAGQPLGATPAVDLGLDGRWPEALWRHLDGALDEAGVVAAIRAAPTPRRRREMSCEALYYTAQQAFADGHDAAARRRLARVVNLKVPYFVEYELALGELARLRGD